MAETLPTAVLAVNSIAGSKQHVIDHVPYLIGRQADQDLVLNFPSVSRRHAHIELAGSSLVLVDLGSRAGVSVNGLPISRHTLADNDLIRIGSSQFAELRFSTANVSPDVELATLLTQVPRGMEGEDGFGRLNWFVEAARRLNQLGGVQEILYALIDTTLSLTAAERGFVFLLRKSGELEFAAGRNCLRQPLREESTISHSAIHHSLASGSGYIIADTLSADAGVPSESMLAHNLRAIICVPLRKKTGSQTPGDANVLGVLYLDSQKERSKLTGVDSELLEIVASEAAMLVQSINMVEAEEEGRRYREELAFASSIQQELMRVRLPESSFAFVEASSIPCKGIGGDFYDVIETDECLYGIVADVSGKGLSAAILGSTLQGLVYSQLLAGLPLSQVAAHANQFLCQKNVGKYATLIIVRISPDGTLEYINCGHVQPLLISDRVVKPLTNCNLPVGLLAGTTYQSELRSIERGEKVLIITDGVSEAENPDGVPYGDNQLIALAAAGASVGEILEDVTSFTKDAPLEDDCTLLALSYRILR